MRRVTVVAIAAVLAAASVGALFQITPSGDRTVTKVQVAEDGDATVSIVTSIELPNESERAAFEDLREALDRPDSDRVASFREAVVRLVDSANASSERRMAASNVSVGTRIEPLPVRRGIVTYRFRWQNIAVVEGDGLSVGEALGGYVLGSNEALEFVLPPGHVADTVAPDADGRSNGTVRWSGPRTFDADRPSLTVVPARDGDRDQGGSGDGADDGGTGGATDGLSLLPWAALLVVVVLAAAGLYAYRRRAGTAPAPDMTDDERVIQMVEDADGRLKQKRIEERTEWSAAKVSQVTSGLEEEGEIEKLRMGRENIIRFPDEDDAI